MITQIAEGLPMLEKLLSFGFTVILALLFVSFVLWYAWKIKPRIDVTTDMLGKLIILNEIAIKTLDKVAGIQERIGDDMIAHKQQMTATLQMVGQRMDHFEEVVDTVVKDRVTNDTVRRIHERIDRAFDSIATKEDITTIHQLVNELFKEVCRK